MKSPVFIHNKKVPVRDLLGFSATLEKYSELDSIISRLGSAKADLKSEASTFSKFTNEINDESTGNDNAEKIRFLCEQLELIDSKKTRGTLQWIFNERINEHFFCSNAYSSLRELLGLPNIMSYFGKLGSNQTIQECTSVVENVTDKLVGVERNCKILCDEIHIKPGVQYQGGHIIGFSVNELEKTSKGDFSFDVSTSFW